MRQCILVESYNQSVLHTNATTVKGMFKMMQQFYRTDASLKLILEHVLEHKKIHRRCDALRYHEKKI